MSDIDYTQIRNEIHKAFGPGLKPTVAEYNLQKELQSFAHQMGPDAFLSLNENKVVYKTSILNITLYGSLDVDNKQCFQFQMEDYLPHRFTSGLVKNSIEDAFASFKELMHEFVTDEF